MGIARDKEDAFLLARLKNQTQSAEGTVVPPPQKGEFRIPFVSNLRIARTEYSYGYTTFTVVWDEPEDIRFVSQYNIYITGLMDDNAQPLGPYAARRSPAYVRVASDHTTNVTLYVQTQILNGLMSELLRSPSCAGVAYGPDYTQDITWAVSTKVTGDSPYTLQTTDYTILGDTSGGNITVKLPASPQTGRVYFIKKISGANTLTIDGNGQNIDGSATRALTVINHTYQLQYSGSTWVILSTCII